MRDHRRELWRVGLISATSSALAVAVLTAGVTAWANLDDDDATDSLPRVVPYEGVLDFDGAPFTGFLDMRFTFHDAPTGGNAAWTESWTQADDRAVQLYAGRFAVSLGTFDDGGLRTLEDVVADAGPIYLGVEVKRTEQGDADWVSLGGRQRLNPVPHALWSARSSDFDVAGDLTVAGTTNLIGATNIGGALRIEGNITRTAGSVVVDDGLQINGDLTDGNGDLVIADGLDVTGIADFQGNLFDSTGDLVVDDSLDVVGTADLQGGLFDSTGDLVIDDNLDLTGTLADSNSDLTIADNLLINGTLTFTGDVSDSNGDVVIADGLDVTGDGGLDIRGSLFDGNSNEVTIQDGLTVTGDVYLQDCRICLLYGDTCDRADDNCDADKAYACVQMEAGSVSPLFLLSDGTIDDNDGFRLAFICDNGNNAESTTRGGGGDWPAGD